MLQLKIKIAKYKSLKIKLVTCLKKLQKLINKMILKHDAAKKKVEVDL